MSLLQVNNLKKVYASPLSLQKVTALNDVSFEIEPGEFVAIMGESGSGKSTLLNLLATLDKPTSGQILLQGKDLSKIRSKDKASFRREQIGFVFQDFNLLDTFNNADNIMLPLVLSGKPFKEMNIKCQALASSLGIKSLQKKYPYECSGGQKQRIAIARALITSPQILLADEPTGALDSKSSQDVLELFERINRTNRQTIVMVTHSIDAASYANRVLFIKDGKVFHQIYKGDKDRLGFYEDISNGLKLMQKRGTLA